jgi:dephospho-CoA kinase
MIIGLTGKICAGKNLAAELFEKWGLCTIDVDTVGHEVLDELSSRLENLFGPQVVNADGSVNRSALGAEVFGDSRKLAMLETLLHPKMTERCLERADSRDQEACPAGTLFNAAVLHTMGLDVHCDAVVFVKAPMFLRLYRAVRSRGMSIGNFLRRNRSQKEIDEKYVSAHVPIYVIMNDRDRGWLETQVDELVGHLGIGKSGEHVQ